MLKDNIKKERKRIGFSQEKLGECLNISQQAIAKWENGFAEPDTENLKKMAVLFGVSIDYLLDHKDSNIINSEDEEFDVIHRAYQGKWTKAEKEKFKQLVKLTFDLKFKDKSD